MNIEVWEAARRLDSALAEMVCQTDDISRVYAALKAERDAALALYLEEPAVYICPTCRGDGHQVVYASAAEARPQSWYVRSLSTYLPWMGLAHRPGGRNSETWYSLRICRTCGGWGLIDGEQRWAWRRAHKEDD